MGIQILIRTWKTAVSKSFNGVLWAVNYFPNKNVSLKLSIPSFSRNKPAGLLVQRKCHRKTVVLEKLPDSSGRSERSKVREEVREVGADADLLSLHWELDCASTLWDSSYPERPEQPSGEPACAWWRTPSFPPAETKSRAPAWEEKHARHHPFIHPKLPSDTRSSLTNVHLWVRLSCFGDAPTVEQRTCAEGGRCPRPWGCRASTPHWSCRCSHMTRGGDAWGVCSPPSRWGPPTRGSGSSRSSPLAPEKHSKSPDSCCVSNAEEKWIKAAGDTSCLSPRASLSWMMASAMVVLQAVTCSTITSLQL